MHSLTTFLILVSSTNILVNDSKVQNFKLELILTNGALNFTAKKRGYHFTHSNIVIKITIIALNKLLRLKMFPIFIFCDHKNELHSEALVEI